MIKAVYLFLIFLNYVYMEYTVYLAHSVKGGRNKRKITSAYLIENNGEVIAVKAMEGASANVSLLQALQSSLKHIPAQSKLHISTNSKYVECAITINNYTSLAIDTLDDIRKYLKRMAKWDIVNKTKDKFYKECKNACSGETSIVEKKEESGNHADCVIQILGDYCNCDKGFIACVSYILDKKSVRGWTQQSDSRIYIYKKIKDCIADALCRALKSLDNKMKVKIVTNSLFIYDFYKSGVCFTKDKQLEEKLAKLINKAGGVFYTFKDFENNSLIKKINKKTLDTFIKD